MTGFHHLFVPGPTNVPEAVRQAMNMPMEDMRAADYPDFVHRLLADLMRVFKNDNGRAFIFPSSGTGAWEAAIANTLNPGDRVLMSRFGQFSLLWVDMAQRFGLDVDVIDTEWGTGVPVDLYAERLANDKDHTIKAVFVTHNETTTGVTSDVAAVRNALNDCGHPALLFVDGVSSLASIDFRQTEWGVDCAVSGSQKGFMLPPGLGFLSVSPKALVAHQNAKQHRTYFSFEDMIRANDSGFFPYTPAVQLLRGLRVSLDLLLGEGLENVYRRHSYLAQGVREAVRAWGLKLCAKDQSWQSDTVSAVLLPEGVDGSEIVRRAHFRYKTALGLGLNKVAGKLFRIGHIGWINEVMMCSAIAASELAMKDCGVKIEPGSGVGAAIRYYTEFAGDQF